jgi:hypothetical protein
VSAGDPPTGPAGGAGGALTVTTPADPELFRRSGPDETTLVDLLDRVIDRGVVVAGDVVLSVAGVDLVHIGLRIVLRGVDERGGVK